MKTVELIEYEDLKRTKQSGSLTDSEIAEAVGTTRQSISSLFNGKAGSLRLLAEVCRVMGVNYKDYLRDLDEKVAA